MMYDNNFDREYKKFKNAQQTMGMLNNMGVFGDNTGMSNFADKFSNFNFGSSPKFNTAPPNYNSPSVISQAQPSALTSAIGNEVSGIGTGTGSSAISDAINAEVSGGASGGVPGGLGWIGIAQNGMKGLQEGFDAAANDDEDQIMGGVGNGIQGFFGSNKYDNDIAQAIAGAGNGAKMGAGVGGPWGAAIGGILGLGSSFLDDL